MSAPLGQHSVRVADKAVVRLWIEGAARDEGVSAGEMAQRMHPQIWEVGADLALAHTPSERAARVQWLDAGSPLSRHELIFDVYLDEAGVEPPGWDDSDEDVDLWWDTHRDGLCNLWWAFALNDVIHEVAEEERQSSDPTFRMLHAVAQSGLTPAALALGDD